MDLQIRHASETIWEIPNCDRYCEHLAHLSPRNTHAVDVSVKDDIDPNELQRQIGEGRRLEAKKRAAKDYKAYLHDVQLTSLYHTKIVVTYLDTVEKHQSARSLTAPIPGITGINHEIVDFQN